MTGLKELKEISAAPHSRSSRVNRAKAILIVFFISIILINTASALNTYTSKDGYTIEYPSSWSVKDDVVQVYTSENGEAWVIIADFPSAGMSLDQIVKEERGYLIEKKRYPSDEKNVNINGLRGIEWKYVDYSESGVGYQYREVILLAGDKYYSITATSRVSNFPLYSKDFEQIFNSFKTEGVPVPAATETKTSYYSLNLAQEEEYSDSMGLEATYGSSYAWADASGDAASWVTPRRLDFGLIEEGTSEVRYYTIKVPEKQYPGTYELIWTRGCKYVSGETCSWNVAMIVYQITVEEKPTPAYTSTSESSTASVKIGLAVFLFIGLYIVVRAVKGAKKREEKPAPVFIPAPTPVPAYPAAPKKPQEPVAKPQANELKELKEKLSKTNQLLDKLDERLVNGELTEAKYKELAGKYKAEADSLKNLIAEKELLSEVGLKTE